MKTWLGHGANGCERAFQNQRLTVEPGCHLCSNGGAEGAAEENRLRRIDAQRIARKVERRFTVEISAFLRGAPAAAPICSVVRIKILARAFSLSSWSVPRSC